MSVIVSHTTCQEQYRRRFVCEESAKSSNRTSHAHESASPHTHVGACHAPTRCAICSSVMNAASIDRVEFQRQMRRRAPGSCISLEVGIDIGNNGEQRVGFQTYTVVCKAFGGAGAPVDGCPCLSDYGVRPTPPDDESTMPRRCRCRGNIPISTRQPTVRSLPAVHRGAVRAEAFCDGRCWHYATTDACL